MRAVSGQTKDKKHHAIAYASKTLLGPQLNYATTVGISYAYLKYKGFRKHIENHCSILPGVF